MGGLIQPIFLFHAKYPCTFNKTPYFQMVIFWGATSLRSRKNVILAATILAKGRCVSRSRTRPAVIQRDKSRTGCQTRYVDQMLRIRKHCVVLLWFIFPGFTFCRENDAIFGEFFFWVMTLKNLLLDLRLKLFILVTFIAQNLFPKTEQAAVTGEQTNYPPLSGTIRK